MSDGQSESALHCLWTNESDLYTRSSVARSSVSGGKSNNGLTITKAFSLGYGLYRMERRTLLTAIFTVVGGATTGCLENSNGMDDSAGSEGRDDSSATETTESSDGEDEPTSTDDAEGIRNTEFEVLGTDPDFDVSASVAYGTDMITVTGTIRGNNTCYTARLGNGTMENGTLTLGVESYEDADDDEGCGEAIIGIEYEAVVAFHGDLPSEVTVEHNGDQITTEQAA